VSYSCYFERGSARIQKHLQVTDILTSCSLQCMSHQWLLCFIVALCHRNLKLFFLIICQPVRFNYFAVSVSCEAACWTSQSEKPKSSFFFGLSSSCNWLWRYVQSVGVAVPLFEVADPPADSQSIVFLLLVWVQLNFGQYRAVFVFLVPKNQFQMHQNWIVN
jgi:hypothetical protein